MARDYKHRAQQRDAQKRRRNHKKDGLGLLRWMAITALLIGFAVFLMYLKSPNFQNNAASQNAPKEFENKKLVAKAGIKTEETKPTPPQFDFYTILPKKEVIVPDHEIKTRTREEMIGKNKKANYVIQVGSSQDIQDADRLRAKLALMGIESKIQKAKVEDSTWYRVKIGPYSQMSSVNTVMTRLKQNGMRPVITESGE